MSEEKVLVIIKQKGLEQGVLERIANTLKQTEIKISEIDKRVFEIRDNINPNISLLNNIKLDDGTILSEEEAEIINNEQLAKGQFVSFVAKGNAVLDDIKKLISNAVVIDGIMMGKIKGDFYDLLHITDDETEINTFMKKETLNKFEGYDKTKPIELTKEEKAQITKAKNGNVKSKAKQKPTRANNADGLELATN
jgi:nucleoside diphosphate kinase